MEQGADGELYGVIGQIRSIPGKRDELLAHLQAGSRAMPGNIAYLIARDEIDADALWITEIWTSKAAHQASLQLPQVQDAIGRARPIIAGFGTRAEVVPVAGAGS